MVSFPQVSHQNPMHTSPPHTRHMPRPISFFSILHPHNIR
jgi:hypothetical protein